MPVLPSPPHFPPIQEEETQPDEPEPEPAHRPPKPPRPDHLLVSCSNCRPSSRDKITIVPLDPNFPKRPSSLPSSPINLLQSLFATFARKSPLHVTSPDLSHKLFHVTRKRDEALLEASRLKLSVSDLQHKLNLLESRCRSVPGPTPSILEPFLLSVNQARSAVSQLSRCLITQLRTAPRSMNRLGSLLSSHGLVNPDPRSFVMGLESVLNRVFYSDFERPVEGEGLMADPADRCRSSWLGYEAVRGICWEDVLSKGTKYYSEGLSRFCDKRMSEVVGMLGWVRARAWPEVLLRAFFGAARGVWMVHLLARSVHPGLPILRVDRGARFDPVYMEDSTGRRVIMGEVVMMVAPGFYGHVAGCGVVKSKVVVAGDCGLEKGRSEVTNF